MAKTQNKTQAMKIQTPSSKVKHRKSGLFYRLFPRPDLGNDVYYLSCNDGMVPSGQIITRTEQELEGIFELP